MTQTRQYVEPGMPVADRDGELVGRVVAVLWPPEGEEPRGLDVDREASMAFMHAFVDALSGAVSQQHQGDYGVVVRLAAVPGNPERFARHEEFQVSEALVRLLVAPDLLAPWPADAASRDSVAPPRGPAPDNRSHDT